MTIISLHNTLSGKKEKFKPLKAGHVNMYQCGPTVYDSAHIGNLRTYIFDDIVRRVFEYNGYKVNQVMNITDVDDKTIRRSHEEKVSLQELTAKYEKLFLEDIATLNILAPHHILSARAHVPDMIKMISTLLDKEFAYKANDGIYLSISKVKNYGALAKLKLDADVKERIENDEYDKENPRDFALWKFADAENKNKSKAEEAVLSEATWDAPFGSGRPGWHIECSAMAISALGETIDIHTGASDLIFPHHTNEIAQSESATGKTFVNYWLHGGFMNVNDTKMSKSKNNFLQLSDIVENAVAPIAFRYWLLTSHYRTQLNFTLEAVQAAQVALFKLCEDIVSWPDGGTIDNETVQKYRNEFTKSINDDFNMPQAIATLWKMIKDTKVSDADKKATALDFDKVLGLRLNEISAIGLEAGTKAVPLAASEIPPEIAALADAREAARLAKDWPQADALRLEIESRGYTLKDTDKGPQIQES